MIWAVFTDSHSAGACPSSRNLMRSSESLQETCDPAQACRFSSRECTSRLSLASWPCCWSGTENVK
jgi:hypothetical protein